MRISLTVLALAIAGTGAAAQQIDLSLPPVTTPISGVPVTFDGALRLAAQNSCRKVAASIDVGLADLSAKLMPIVSSAGVNRSKSCGDTVRINGARLSRAGAGLGVKVDGFVARQECVITKVPEFRGLKVTMKNRTVASNTFSTNASVTAGFTPQVIGGNSVRLVLTSGPSTAVSNDAYRFLIAAFNLQGRIDGSIKGAIQGALQNDDLWLRLPPEVSQYGVSLTDARIVDRSGAPAMRLSGEVDVPPLLASALMKSLGAAACR